MKKIISKLNKHPLAPTMLIGMLLMLSSFQKSFSQSNLPNQNMNSRASESILNNDVPKFCAEPAIDTAALRQAMEYEAAHTTSLLPPNFSIRVYFHILRYDNGTNPATTVGAIQNEFNTLVADYAADNICFINCGFDYIDNSNLDTNYNADNGPFTLFNPYRIPNCINIFYSQKIKGNNPACGGGCGYGGYAFSIPNTFCLIASGNVGGSTISHEVGHCFGLLHTFETNYGYEIIGGYQSSSHGDLITDTPADPYAYVGQGCFSSAGGLYTGTCTDPLGQSNFTPPYDNIMSYWSLQTFTSGQISRLNGFLNSNSGLMGCQSSPAVVLNSSYSSINGYQIISSTGAITNSGPVVFNSSAKIMLISESVILSPGFYTLPNLTGFVYIRPASCGSFLPRASSETNSPIIEDENNTDIKCYPNPFSNNITVEFTLTKDDNTSIALYDLIGKKIKTIAQSSFSKGKHDLSFDTSDVPAGIYLVVLQCSDFKKEQKLLKTN